MAVAYTICDTFDLLNEAIEELSNSPYVVVDCEGQSLSRPNGKLSLLNLGSSKANKVFLLDIPSLLDKRSSIIYDANEPLKSLKELLQAKSIRKIMWDGRGDFLEIFEACEILLDGVLDLQLVELYSFMNSRTRDRERIDRLKSAIRHMTHLNTNQLAELEAIIGMQRFVTELQKKKELSIHGQGKSGE